MSTLPDTYIEILSYLRDAPGGLTTGQLFSEAKKRRYLGFSKSDIVSGIVYRLRNSGLLTTSNGSGGKTHKITDLGLQRLTELGLISSDGAADPNKPDIAPLNKMADEIIQDIQDENTNTYPPSAIGELHDASIDQPKRLESGTAYRLDQIFDEIKCMICTCSPVQIADKRLKISVLEKLEPLYNDEISRVLGDIRRDLEQLGAE